MVYFYKSTNPLISYFKQTTLIKKEKIKKNKYYHFMMCAKPYKDYEYSIVECEKL